MNESRIKLIAHSAECNINGYGYCDCGADSNRYLSEKDVKEIVSRNNEVIDNLTETVKSLRQALAQPKQTMTPISPDQYERLCFTCGACVGKPWVGLHLDDMPEMHSGDRSFLHGAKWAEAKLKVKNT